MMHQRRLGLNVEQYLLTKEQLSLKRKTTVADQRKGSLRTEEKITTMVYKRCTLRIQADTKTILKRTLRLNEGDREWSTGSKRCCFLSSDLEIAPYSQRKGNGGSSRNTLVGIDVPIWPPANIKSHDACKALDW